MKKIITLIFFFSIFCSCNNGNQKQDKVSSEDLKNLSASELEKIGFEKIASPQTFEDGIKYLEEAAYKGSSKAALEVGLRYAWGNGVIKDKWKARTFLEKNKYDNDARFELGKIIFEDAQTDKDYKEAYEYFQGITYGRNDNSSEYMLGYMNYFGLGTLKDYKSAYKYFDASTKRPNSDTLYGADILGLGDACYYLGIMALEGQGCEKDYGLAESHFSKGFFSNACKYMLGVMNYHGLCKRSSKEMAALLIKQVYDLQGLTEFDKEFNLKAKQFWDEHELWKYSETK
jgi:TPR repeat protein